MTENTTNTAEAVQEKREIRTLTADIVSAAITAGKVSFEQIPELIRDVSASLRGEDAAEVKAQNQRGEPAVHPRKSVFKDYIICLEDGKKLKMLKRHLKTTYNMTPAEYRARWGLPQEYPMVAPSYAEKRSALAKKIGLGVARRGTRR